MTRKRPRRRSPSACASFRNPNSEIRNAFTLIEVILAIGLSATLLALLGGAINLYLIRLDASRTEVEQGQIARGVLRLVADDLRSAATVYTQDTSAADLLAASQATFDVDDLDQIAEDDGQETAADLRRPPGMYGDAAQVQLDVNKSRPVDPVIEFGSGEAQVAPATLLGMTTVVYFVTEQGLTRQEVGRDIDLWETDQASTASREASTRVIAPEVVQMQLLYSDGEQTLGAWDSEEQEGALPVAVEVQLTFRHSRGDGAGDDAGDGAEDADQSYRTYRMVVALPSANPAVESDSTDEESL